MGMAKKVDIRGKMRKITISMRKDKICQEILEELFVDGWTEFYWYLWDQDTGNGAS